MRLRILIPVLAASVTIIGAEQAMACSCAPINAKRALRQSDAAIVGRLITVIPQGSHAEYTYLVRRVYKGKARIDEGDLLTVNAPPDEAACGLPAQPGERYGLFLDRFRGEWSSSLCQVVSPQKMRQAAEGRGSRQLRAGCAEGPVPA